MREVAVTEGRQGRGPDPLGLAVNGYGLGDLAAAHRRQSATPTWTASSASTTSNIAWRRRLPPARPQRQCAPLRGPDRVGAAVLSRSAAASAPSPTTFEDLHGLEQLPGLAVQRLMADGYGFGAEGDWKTAALVRAMKVMAAGLPGGTSFMEDYTYHLHPGGVQGAGRPHAGVLPLAGRRQALAARSIPWASAARPTRRGWCSTCPGRPGGERVPASTWATASA